MKFIGREKEIKKLRKAYQSGSSEFVAVYGRRRVGKTMLIRHVLEEATTFYSTATINISNETQLFNFHFALQNSHPSAKDFDVPSNWFFAFQNLIKVLEQSKQAKKIVFLDELPWFDAPNSDFLPSLDFFWNAWASARTDILLVVCGSAASWMIKNLVDNKGGLHNRITEKIVLKPFSLYETELFLKTKNSTIDRYQILQLYMVFGGIPHYLKAIDGSLSASQNIENLCFREDGLLMNEFSNLFHALFHKAERHIEVVEAIAKKNIGLTREDIIQNSSLPNNGRTTQLLQELEVSGFIRNYKAFGNKKKGSLYQLNDFFTLFYFKFMKNAAPEDADNWLKSINSPQYRAWSGYAFEQICLYHIQQIKKGLGIAGVLTYSSAWRSKTSKKGAQIDLVIDRNDHVINLCEMKFSQSKFTITKAYAENLENKIQAFQEESKTKKSLFLTVITHNGLAENEYSRRLVQSTLSGEVLFMDLD